MSSLTTPAHPAQGALSAWIPKETPDSQAMASKAGEGWEGLPGLHSRNHARRWGGWGRRGDSLETWTSAGTQVS